MERKTRGQSMKELTLEDYKRLYELSVAECKEERAKNKELHHKIARMREQLAAPKYQEKVKMAETLRKEIEQMERMVKKGTIEQPPRVYEGPVNEMTYDIYTVIPTILYSCDPTLVFEHSLYDAKGNLTHYISLRFGIDKFGNENVMQKFNNEEERPLFWRQEYKLGLGFAAYCIYGEFIGFTSSHPMALQYAIDAADYARITKSDQYELKDCGADSPNRRLKKLREQMEAKGIKEPEYT